MIDGPAGDTYGSTVSAAPLFIGRGLLIKILCYVSLKCDQHSLSVHLQSPIFSTVPSEQLHHLPAASFITLLQERVHTADMAVGSVLYKPAARLLYVAVDLAGAAGSVYIPPCC